MFVRNCWYVAAWASEITRAPLARMFLGEPVLLYRREDGTAVALEDRCCHRNVPLSLGRITGDAVRCGYHGMTFGPDGVPAMSIAGRRPMPSCRRTAPSMSGSRRPDRSVRTATATRRCGCAPC